jgi:hypothetical protein
MYTWGNRGFSVFGTNFPAFYLLTVSALLLGFTYFFPARVQALTLTPTPVSADYSWKTCSGNEDDPSCAPSVVAPKEGNVSPTPPSYDQDDDKKPTPVYPSPKPIKPESSPKIKTKYESGGGFFSRLFADILEDLIIHAFHSSYHKNSSLSLNAGSLSRRVGLDMELESRFGILMRLLASNHRVGVYTGWRFYLPPNRHRGPYLGWYIGAHSRSIPYQHSGYQIGGTCGYRHIFANTFFLDFNLTHLTEASGIRSETQIRPMVGIRW